MSDMAAFAGALSTIMSILVAVLAYQQWQHRRELDQLRDSMRNIGARLEMPQHELPPLPSAADEYAPDAVVDEESVEREWRLPTSLRGGWDA